jgi:hypothetical protein
LLVDSQGENKVRLSLPGQLEFDDRFHGNGERPEQRGRGPVRDELAPFIAPLRRGELRKVGAYGNGYVAKLVNNQLWKIQAAAIGEAMVTAKLAGWIL